MVECGEDLCMQCPTMNILFGCLVASLTMLDHFWRMLCWHQMYSFALTIVRSLHVVGVLTRLVTL